MNGWAKIEARTLADRVYDAVLRRILAGELSAGAFVREQELSEALEVSRTPVREALNRLASAGFLERLPHRGYRVPTESFTALHELYPIISSLELLAGRLAFATVAAEDLRLLRELNGRMREAAAAGDVVEAIALNDRFHGHIAGLAGNERLVRLLEELRAPLLRLETWYYSGQERAERSASEHDALIEALETGEPERALVIFERNMSLTVTALRERAQERSEVRESG